MESRREALDKFRSTQQEKLRLRIALQEFLRGQELPEAVREEYECYLRKRRRPAAEELIQAGEVAGLKILKDRKILDLNFLDFYLERARACGQTEVVAWLLGLKYREGFAEKDYEQMCIRDSLSGLPANQAKDIIILGGKKLCLQC